MTAVLAGVQPPRQAKAFSKEKAHVRPSGDMCIFCTYGPERSDVVVYSCIP